MNRRRSPRCCQVVEMSAVEDDVKDSVHRGEYSKSDAAELQVKFACLTDWVRVRILLTSAEHLLTLGLQSVHHFDYASRCD